MKRTKEGINHKGEKVLKVYSENCPICHEYMVYFEFIFNINPTIESESDKLIRIQQIDELMEKVKRGDKMDTILGVLFGCPIHYPNNSKKDLDKRKKRPYITLDAEDVYYINQTPISHVYLTQKIK